jgi:phosphoribosylformylglycinamidine cyclo-ligase
MAHITGAGLPGNIPRVLPTNCNAVIKKSSWPRPSIFNFLQKTGPVQEEEMFNVFNMGIGYVVIVAEDFADAAARLLIKEGEKVYNIGRIARGTGKVVLKD